MEQDANVLLIIPNVSNQQQLINIIQDYQFAYPKHIFWGYFKDADNLDSKITNDPYLDIFTYIFVLPMITNTYNNTYVKNIINDIINKMYLTQFVDNIPFTILRLMIVPDTYELLIKNEKSAICEYETIEDKETFIPLPFNLDKKENILQNNYLVLYRNQVLNWKTELALL
jgi:hypothetical protein